MREIIKWLFLDVVKNKGKETLKKIFMIESLYILVIVHYF